MTSHNGPQPHPSFPSLSPAVNAGTSLEGAGQGKRANAPPPHPRTRAEKRLRRLRRWQARIGLVFLTLAVAYLANGRLVEVPVPIVVSALCLRRALINTRRLNHLDGAG